jgi:hypothetical protein
MVSKTSPLVAASSVPRRAPKSQHEPPRAVRLLARVRPVSLDRRRSVGEDPASSALLAARAGALTSDRPGFLGSSFVLPNGSWYHGRREAS